jgi:hypothetical protein
MVRIVSPTGRGKWQLMCSRFGSRGRYLVVVVAVWDNGRDLVGGKIRLDLEPFIHVDDRHGHILSNTRSRPYPLQHAQQIANHASPRTMGRRVGFHQLREPVEVGIVKWLFPPVNASPASSRTLRMARGQCGSLDLHCERLALSTPCRSSRRTKILDFHQRSGLISDRVG